MKKRKLGVLLICITAASLLLWALYINLGRYLDVTQGPEPSDIIVVLGGDWNGWRIKKGLELLKQGYSKSDSILLNPWSELFLRENGKIYRKEKAYLLAHGIPESNIKFFRSWGRTYYELQSIKKYLKEHGFNSVIVVTDPPHTRRVKIITKYLLGYEKAKVKVTIVGADVPWWSKRDYYKNETAKDYAFSELLKIPYNIVVYGILDRYHILDFLRKVYHGLKDFFAFSSVHEETIRKTEKCFDPSMRTAS